MSDGSADLHVKVRHRDRPPKPYKWEIYRGNAHPSPTPSACETHCNKTNMKPAFSADAARRRSEGESRGGISPPRAHRTVREPLDSYGSQHPAVCIQKTPVGEEPRRAS